MGTAATFDLLINYREVVTVQQWEKRIEVWGELMYAVDELDRRGLILVSV